MAEKTRAVLCHHAQGVRAADGRRDGPRDRDRRRADIRTDIRAEDDLARFTAAVDVPKGSCLHAHQVPGLRLVRRNGRRPRCAPRSRPRSPARCRPAGRACSASSGRSWTTSGRSPTSSIDGDDELQQAIRFALFHILQAGARGETRAIPGKGLTGPGYDGHAFWDTEMFVLPVLTYTLPDAARDALRWRHSTLDKARERAQVLGLKGAAFPWRSINGAECSAYWPAGTAAFHVSGDVAYAAQQYLDATATRTSTARKPPRSWWRPRGCGARSATTTGTTGSASTASPARTSTRRSWTTTSTPT